MVNYGSLRSDQGWVNSPLALADNLMADFYASDYSQSYLFEGKIRSMSYLVASNQGDFAALCLAVGVELRDYFTRYFSNVTATAENVTDENSGYNTMEVILTFCDKNEYEKKGAAAQIFTLSEVLNLNNGSFTRVLSNTI